MEPYTDDSLDTIVIVVAVLSFLVFVIMMVVMGLCLAVCVCAVIWMVPF